MPSSGNPLYKHVMEAAGFYRNDTPVAGVYPARELNDAPNRGDTESIDRLFRYAPLIDSERLGVTDVYEWSGNSCIYFKSLNETPSSGDLNKHVGQWHRASWNNGQARMLWVVTPTEVRVFNAYAKPPENGVVVGNPEVELFHALGDQLAELNKAKLLRRDIESGEFWETQTGRRIDRAHRVDHELLEDLKLAAKNLGAAGLDVARAHRLLLQTIFVAFLESRGLLPPKIFDGMQVGRFGDIVRSVRATRQFFSRMHDEFDGDLFPQLADREENSPSDDGFTAPQLKVVWHILNKTEQTGQQRFWPYDFQVIPIELISSVYETFLRAEAEEEADERGVHYTPLNLVHLVLSEALDSSVPLDAKILDLSCGSGVFLVEGLRRLVARRVASGDKLSRKLIREVLFSQIYGVDIKGPAVEVAAFSLCLAALEMEPKNTNGSPIRFQRPLTEKNLFAADAFDERSSFNTADPFKNKLFSVVVGNPPWTAPKGKGSKNAATAPPKHIKYCQTRVPPFPLAHDNPPDPAFFRRAEDFACAGAKFGMILAATRFYSQQEDSRKVKQRIFSKYRPRLVINLSQVHRDLFPNAEQPALVLISENTPATESDTFTFCSVERSSSFKKHGAFEIGPESVRVLPVMDVGSHRDALKVASWGTARDWQLVQKLGKQPTLRRLLDDFGVKICSGYNRGTPRKSTPTEMIGKPLLNQGAFRHCGINWPLLTEVFTEPKLEAPRDPKIYVHPFIIIAHSLLGNRGAAALNVEDDLIFTKRYTAIPVKQIDRRAARYLNGILNSSVATYFLFLTSSVWGVERFETRQDDWLNVPVPSIPLSTSAAFEGLLCVEKALREGAKNGKEQRTLLAELDEAVFDLFDLNKNERAIVEDMVNLTIDFQRKHETSDALSKCTRSDVEQYAKWVIRVIEPILQPKRQHTLKARIFYTTNQSVVSAGKQPSRSLRAVEFLFQKGAAKNEAVEITPVPNLDEALGHIAAELDEELVEGLYTRRHLRIYQGNRVYIIKPDQKRCWSRSAALNDADAIIADHLRD